MRNSGGVAGDDDIELVLVTMAFDARGGAEADRLQGVLANYIVMTRGQPGCRNVDLCASATRPARFVVIQKWESAEAQQRHFDSAVMVDMAESCRDLLASPPEIDLLESISAHDLA